MKQVLSAATPAEAFLAQAVLEAAGIRAVVSGEHRFAMAGGIPVGPDTRPSVWVIDDQDADDARDILARGSPPEDEDPGTEATKSPRHSRPARWIALALAVAIVTFGLCLTIW